MFFFPLYFAFALSEPLYRRDICVVCSSSSSFSLFSFLLRRTRVRWKLFHSRSSSSSSINRSTSNVKENVCYIYICLIHTYMCMCMLIFVLVFDTADDHFLEDFPIFKSSNYCQQLSHSHSVSIFVHPTTNAAAALSLAHSLAQSDGIVYIFDCNNFFNKKKAKFFGSNFVTHSSF